MATSKIDLSQTVPVLVETGEKGVFFESVVRGREFRWVEADTVPDRSFGHRRSEMFIGADRKIWLWSDFENVSVLVT